MFCTYVSPRIKFSTINTEVFRFSRNPSQCNPQVSGETLHPIKKFRYLRLVVTNDERQNKEIDTGFEKASAVLRER